MTSGDRAGGFVLPSSDRAGGFVLPSSEQAMLLNAALDTDGAAIRYFQQWITAVDFEGPLDEGSFNTLPLLWSVLAAKSFDHPFMPRLKGIFRNSWVKSTQRNGAAEALLAILRIEKIPTLLVKGLPLSLGFFDKPALRPMNDIDVVVPAEDLPAASAALTRAGWQAGKSNWKIDRVIRHALQHKHPTYGEVDLHWHVLFECPRDDVDRHFWDAAKPLQIGSETTLQPCPTDLLLHVIVHGLRWNPFPPMRWVTDCAMVLRSGAVVDWDRFVAFGRQQRLGMRLALGLSTLRNDFGLPIPAEVLEGLAGRDSLMEKVEILAMRGDERSGWRHVRRLAHVLRLLQSDQIHGLPGAIAREVLTRGRRHLGPRPGVSGNAH